MALFEDWLFDINAKFSNDGNRKILMILDNFSGHAIEKEFSNIKLLFLPPNTTSLIQPLDQGIINSFKNYYKKRMLAFVCVEIMNNPEKTRNEMVDSINLYKALIWIAFAWKNVTANTISNCWKKSAILTCFDNENLNTLLQATFEETKNNEALLKNEHNPENDDIDVIELSFPELIKQIGEFDIDGDNFLEKTSTIDEIRSLIIESSLEVEEDTFNNKNENLDEEEFQFCNKEKGISYLKEISPLDSELIFEMTKKINHFLEFKDLLDLKEDFGKIQRKIYLEKIRENPTLINEPNEKKNN